MKNNGVEIFPGIVVYENVIDNSEELISLAMKSNNWRNSKVVLGTSSVEVLTDEDIRKTRVLDVPGIYSNDLEWFSVSKTVWEYANNYGIEFDIAYSEMEPMQFLHYYPNQGFYKSHCDDGPGSPRIFSALLYLNDVVEGGETYFDRIDVSITPKKNRLVIFPSNYVYTHEAKTPVSNDKFVLVTWFNPIQ